MWIPSRCLRAVRHRRLEGLDPWTAPLFSDAVRRNSHWVPANEAEKVARMAGGRIIELVRQGQLESVLFNVRRGGSRTEYWIRRESLDRWIAKRDLELARYMPRSEAQRTLGLKNITVMAGAPRRL